MPRHAPTQSAETAKYATAPPRAPSADPAKAALKTTRSAETTRPEKLVPPMSACVKRSGMGATTPKSEPWHTASAAPVSATATYVSARDVDVAGTARQSRNAAYPARIRARGSTLSPNRSTAHRDARLGRKYSTPNARSTCSRG